MEAPEYYRSSSSSQYPLVDQAADHFIVDDLLDFSNDDDSAAAVGLSAGADTMTAAHFTDLSISTSSSDSSFPSYHPHFSRSFLADINDFCEPHDQLQELEWLSNFEEEPFSNEDLEKLQLISGIKSSYSSSSSSSSPSSSQAARSTVPSKARSKRSRVAPSSWSSTRPVVISPEPIEAAPPRPKKKEPADRHRGLCMDGRRCLHCGADKTPQWRMGPMGPKTLCNACGVRFKSGRLVPEYRPASSPSFVVSEHSNSHRKVVELRRQKEMMMIQQQQQQFLPHGDAMLIKQRVDYQQLI